MCSRLMTLPLIITSVNKMQQDKRMHTLGVQYFPFCPSFHSPHSLADIVHLSCKLLLLFGRPLLILLTQLFLGCLFLRTSLFTLSDAVGDHVSFELIHHVDPIEFIALIMLDSSMCFSQEVSGVERRPHEV